ncbi:hypothetical protein [Bradyrhizobium sp. WSM2254]|uniref:hypothetical protein n=1 Tax=Bradyrhizobium sp. WSM2254 TaxID=1188263 RepID=UPI000413968F|nr:hypothetical protein [Bradyrhizobium sp. WSM2254]
MGLTPGTVSEYVTADHSAQIETKLAAIAATDDNYRKAGPTIASSAREVVASSEMIVNWKEPQPSEGVQMPREPDHLLHRDCVRN